MNKYKDNNEIVKEFGNDIFIIHYPFRWGGQFIDKSFWCALDMSDMSAYDYHLKDHLKKDLTEQGKKWIVVRHHLRNKGITILEKSSHFNEEKEQ